MCDLLVKNYDLGIMMASVNDFKYLQKKCEKYYDVLIENVSLKKDISDSSKKERLGFYLLLLEEICGEMDVETLVDMITDTEFNDLHTGTRNDDFGVDAIYIDEDNNNIKLFSFKYRSKFSEKRQSLNEAMITSKFLNVLDTENLNGIEGKLKKYARSIIKKLNSTDEWNVQLYFISNETSEILNDDCHIANFKDKYDIEVITVGLPTITQLLSIRPKPINAIFSLENEAVMTYQEDNKDTDKSFIARITCSEIVRLTSNSSDLRLKYQIEDYSELSKAKIDYGVLFDNVRGFVVKSKYNPNIIDSLANNPSKFFMYNNGITIVAKSISTKITNGNKRVKISINDFQILNGGQTLRSIHKYNGLDAKNIKNNLSKAEVLVRIFMVNDEVNTINKIAEYTNSQNRIQASDLKSLRSEQILIENFLNEHGIIYARKSGDTGIDKSRTYSHKITMEKLGQILYSLDGFPEKSTNSKQKIFSELYDGLFVDNFKIDKVAQIVEDYFLVIGAYKNSEFKGVNIKYFYIMYLKDKFPELDESLLIEELEYYLEEYAPENETSNVRKMGQLRFRTELVAHITGMES